MTERAAIPVLPTRLPGVLGDLPTPFGASQIDGLPGSVCWFNGSWLVSTDAWEDRRLGLLDQRSGIWQEDDAPAGWIRQPIVADDGTLAVLVHERNADCGHVYVRRAGHWDGIAQGVGIGAVTDWDGLRLAQRDDDGQATALTRTGHLIRVEQGDGPPRIVIGGTRAAIGLPRGATVTHLAPAPDRELMAAVVRRGSAHQTQVFCLRTGRALARTSFREPVHSRPMWLDADRIVLLVERWPSLVPVVWDWRHDEREYPWPRRLMGTVRSVGVAPDGTCAAAVSTPEVARRLCSLDDLDAVAVRGADREIRPVVVTTTDGQRLPCLVFEPSSTPRGTVLYFPGGPHEPMWAEHSAFSLAMNDEGWRVVRVNVRSSGLREEGFRPVRPVRYGVDDVQDAVAVIEALGAGPVVTMGMSYGGYIAAMAGQQSDRCRATVVLSGFLSPRDLDRSEHPDVLRFVREAFVTAPRAPAALTKPVFVAHGSADPRVPIDAVRAHMSRARAGSTIVELAGVGHAILSDHDARLTYPTLLAWLRTMAPPSPSGHFPAADRNGDHRERRAS
jgi:pimeloyl-ACP methyl ester carboxylesterase